VTFYDFLSVNNDANVPSKSNRQKTFVGILKVAEEKNRTRDAFGAGSVSQKYGSEVPDPYQNVTDLEHCNMMLQTRVSARGKAYNKSPMKGSEV
jgi:hypothetical protein